MKIRILASGEIRHIDNSTGSALVSAGLAESLSTTDDKPGRLPRPGDAIAPSPIWDVVIVGNIRKELAIRMTLGNQDALYVGAPKDVNSKVSWPGGCRYTNGFGREVPEEIAKQYARQWKDNPQLHAAGVRIEGNTPTENEAMAHELKQREGR